MTTRKRRPGAGPKFKLTRDQVEWAEAWIRQGWSVSDTAAALSVDVKTLYRARRRLAAQREATN